MEKLYSVDPDAAFILNGVAQALKLVSEMSLVSLAECKNYIIALCPKNKGLPHTLFRKGVELGRISEQKRMIVHIQAIGAVTKKDSITPRPLTDCSRPFGCSLNSFISAGNFVRKRR